MYSPPRLRIANGSRWLAVAAVGFGWSLQRSFLPWINRQHAVCMFITIVPLTLAMKFIDLRAGRLTPIIVAIG